MNCANHPDRERSAFCQNCGKPLCTECIRTVGNTVLCEPCLQLRAAVPPGAAYPVPPSAPSPGLAALLGFIPGVGAMYNGQYAKGIVHLIVFVVLVSLSNQINVFGILVAGWIFYMVIEAHHTARARRDGTPLPNPFGLNDIGERLGFGRNWPSAAGAAAPPYTPAGWSTPDPVPGASPTPGAAAYPPPPSAGYTYVPPVSSWGAPQDAYGVPPVAPGAPAPGYVDPGVPPVQRVPTGAIWLIGLGLLFLFGNMGFFYLRGRFLGPLLLIGVGVWIFVSRMMSSGAGLENDGTAFYSWRLASALRGSIWVFATGVIWLLDAFHILSWGSSWPLYLIVAGVMLLLRRTLPGFSGAPCPPPGYGPPPSGTHPGPVPGPADTQSPVETSTSIVPVAQGITREEGR